MSHSRLLSQVFTNCKATLVKKKLVLWSIIQSLLELEHEAIEEGSCRVYVGGLRLIKPGGIPPHSTLIWLTPLQVAACLHCTPPKRCSSTAFLDKALHTLTLGAESAESQGWGLEKSRVAQTTSCQAVSNCSTCSTCCTCSSV